MQSKKSFSNDGSLRTSPQTGVAISFFNRTVFKKNLTRFAPVWMIYALGLCVWLLMMYSDQAAGSEYGRRLGFAYDFSYGMVEVFMYWNLLYALLTCQLLFGDLYNSRMCNALHALPLRREEWFVTNCLSGLAFSVIPTLVGVLVVLPMLAASILENAWILALLWFLSINLQFICCFGMAAFAAMCVGSRLTMVAGYGLLHFGAYITYWLVDTVYTPMLYGVITPTTLANNLTPLAHMMEYRYVEIENMVYEYQMMEQGLSFADLTLQFSLTEHWWRIFAVAGVGILFAVLALLLYRKRDLECAGDAVAFPILKPVFQVLCALFVMCAGQFIVAFILGMGDFGFPIMGICLVIGWFVGKMMIERSTRVFRLKNWYGLAALAACIALTLAATRLDILNIEERLPDRDKIEAVSLETNRSSSQIIDEDHWEDVIRLHELAFTERVEEQGLYIIEEDGTRIRYSTYDGNVMPAKEPGTDIEGMLGYEDYVQAGNIRIVYEMKDGSRMTRRYNIWADGETGDLTRKNLSDWAFFTMDKARVQGELVPVLDAALDEFVAFNVTGFNFREKEIFQDKEEAESFLKAVQADCAAGLMIQDSNFHRGIYSREIVDEYSGEPYLDTRENLYVSIEGRHGGWQILVYPDCVNTMSWLIDRGLVNFTVYPDAIMLPG